MTAASASVSPNAAGDVAGIEASSIGCTSARCVITASVTDGIKAKTALLDPANGSVRVTPWSSAAATISQVACPTGATCLTIGYNTRNFTAVITAISTQTGAGKVTAQLPTTDQYNLLNIACPSSKYCWVDGYSALPGVQLPTWALLLKVSATGKILQRTVNKSYATFQAVTCESSTTCLVARQTHGFRYQSMTLVNGKLGQPHDYPANYLALDASCYSTKVCYSIASRDGGAADVVAFSLNHKNGALGAAIRLPLTATGIACYNAAQCVSVGSVTVGVGGNQTTEAAYAVITRGKVGKPVVASKNLSSTFTGASCASPKECYAVGTYYNTRAETTDSIVAKV